MSRGIDTLRVPAMTALLKAQREKLGKTQLEMSKALGYTSPMIISTWERGLACPSPIKLKQVARIYKLPKQQLIQIFVEHYESQLNKLVGEAG